MNFLKSSTLKNVILCILCVYVYAYGCMHAKVSVWQSEKNLQEWSLPLPWESWRWNLGLTDRLWRCFYMSQLWGAPASWRRPLQGQGQRWSSDEPYGSKRWKCCCWDTLVCSGIVRDDRIKTRNGHDGRFPYSYIILLNIPPVTEVSQMSALPPVINQTRLSHVHSARPFTLTSGQRHLMQLSHCFQFPHSTQ